MTGNYKKDVNADSVDAPEGALIAIKGNVEQGVVEISFPFPIEAIMLEPKTAKQVGEFLIKQAQKMMN